MKKYIIIGSVVTIALGVALFFVFNNSNGKQKFITDKITRGDIKSTISSTGTVNAVTTVQVGTQVSGTIQKLFVDFNSPVKKDSCLPRLIHQYLKLRWDRHGQTCFRRKPTWKNRR